MRIAVINEVSSSAKNADILSALRGFGHEIFNVGMMNPEQTPALTYIHTGLMSGILLNTQACDLVIGGCGTGQGYMNSAMQYPNVIAGLLVDSLDAWLFSQINDGNCISLPLNKGYGWGADINLKYIFEKLFKDESGLGYPEHRKESQAQSRDILRKLSKDAHKPLPYIISSLPPQIVTDIFATPAFRDVFMKESQNTSLRDEIISVSGLSGLQGLY